MANKIKNEIKIGLMVVVAILGLVLGLNYLKGNSIFSSDREFYTIYENVQGLQEAAAVEINGFTVGKVTSIVLQEDKTIKVGFIVNKKLDIPKGTVAKLTTSDFISGAKIIAIELGDSKEFLEEGSFVNGKDSEGILDNISETVTPLVGSVRGTLITLDTLLNAINGIVNEQTRHHLHNSFASLDATLKQMSDLSSALNRQTENLNAIMVNANSVISNLATNNEKINTSFDNLETFTSKLDQTDIDKTLNNLEATSSELKNLAAKANDSSGSLGMILSDKNLYGNLTSTLAALDTLLTDVKKHPAKYINVSVFGSRERR